jgi:translation initiation factor 3 subunit L
MLIEEPPVEPVQRHLAAFISEIRAMMLASTLRSFLRLYTSLDTKKLANFLDADEEEMVQQMMVLKRASRSLGRLGNEKGLLEGQTISTSDLSFAINEVWHKCSDCIFSATYGIRFPQWQNMVHIAESTVGRRYAGWFINNTERAQRIFDDLRKNPLPVGSKVLESRPRSRKCRGVGSRCHDGWMNN